MAGESKNGMQCAVFETLLSEALDETLTGTKLESFQAHGRLCSICGPLLAEADAGRRWLKSVAEEEPPSNLVSNILIATTGRVSERTQAQTGSAGSWKDALSRWLGPVFTPAFAVARQPRFAMSFGMAFFSLSITLSMAGVKMSDVRSINLRPSAIKRTYYETSGRVVKYYENIRFVYEIESRVRQFKEATAPAQPPPEQNNNNEDRKDKTKNNTSGQPEQKQERNYSQEGSQPVFASLPDDAPVVPVTTYRRFV